jgi:uncharacterized protein DUF732
MRTRTTLLLLAATAASFTACGVTAPATFDGKGSPRLSQASLDPEAAFLAEVRDAEPEMSATTDDKTILDYGHSVCEQLADGMTSDDIAETISDQVDDQDVALSIAATAGIAMRVLCPELDNS